MLKRLSWVGCWVLLLVLMGCDDTNKQAEDAPATDKVQVLETHIQAIPLEDDAVTTRFGALEMVRSSPENPPDTLKLQGKQVFQKTHFYLSLHDYVMQNARDVVLFGTNCGDTSCPENDFYFLILEKGKEPQVVTQDTFKANPDDIAMTSDSDKLMVDLGFSAGKHKVATLQAAQLSINLEAATDTALEDDDCQWLYNDAMQSCIDARDNDAACADPQSWFAEDLSNALNAIANLPGFVQSAFDKQCKSTCERGDKSADYVAFAHEVCSKTVVAPLPVTPEPTTNPAPPNNPAVSTPAVNTAPPVTAPAVPPATPATTAPAKP